MTLTEAKEIVNAICLKHTDGFTLLEGKGVWPDSSKQPIKEDSLICVLMNVHEDQVRSIVSEILNVLNQQSILLEKIPAGILFYDASRQMHR